VIQAELWELVEDVCSLRDAADTVKKVLTGETKPNA
jgi:hypothetical protein